MQGFLDDQPMGKIYVARNDVVFSSKVVLNPDLYYIRNERRSILADHGATAIPN